MASFGVALPLTRNSIDGFTMLKDFNRVVKQNLKMLLLTNPGERVMNPNFGVGLKRMIFENFDDSVFGRAESRIRNQIQAFMPAIRILRIDFDSSNMDRNLLGIRLSYAVPNVGMTDILEFTL